MRAVSSSFLGVSLVLLLGGCATTLMDKSQVRIAEERSNFVRQALTDAYGQLEDANEQGALVITDRSGQHIATALGDSAIEAIGGRDGAKLPDESICFFITKHDLAIEPQSYRCSVIDQEARRLALLRTDIDASRAEVAKMVAAFTEYGDALSTAMRLGMINADLIDAHASLLDQLVGFTKVNKENLAEMNATLERLLSEFNSNTKKLEEAIGKLPK